MLAVRSRGYQVPELAGSSRASCRFYENADRTGCCGRRWFAHSAFAVGVSVASMPIKPPDCLDQNDS